MFADVWHFSVLTSTFTLLTTRVTPRYFHSIGFAARRASNTLTLVTVSSTPIGTDIETLDVSSANRSAVHLATVNMSFIDRPVIGDSQLSDSLFLVRFFL